jgi:SanA protein
MHNEGMNFVRRYYRWGIVLVLLLVLICICVPIMMRILVKSYTYTSFQNVPVTQVAIVLGASVVGHKPSPILAARADMAIQLYEAGKVSKILVTGDNGELSHDEVTPVREYLTAAGIPNDDIFLDHAGFDTYSSMYRALKVFDVTSATIVTQDFHLPRSLFIARNLGINAYGVVADGQGSWYDYLREIPASDKALTNLLTGRLPKYLGSQYPITQSGTSTWY